MLSASSTLVWEAARLHSTPHSPHPTNLHHRANQQIGKPRCIFLSPPLSLCSSSSASFNRIFTLSSFPAIAFPPHQPVIRPVPRCSPPSAAPPLFRPTPVRSDISLPGIPSASLTARSSPIRRGPFPRRQTVIPHLLVQLPQQQLPLHCPLISHSLSTHARLLRVLITNP